MSTMTLEQVRGLLPSYLDDGGWHTEAENFRKGVDLDSYENELRLIDWVLRHAHLAQPAQAVDVGAKGTPERRLFDLAREWSDNKIHTYRLMASIEAIIAEVRALSGEKAGPAGDGWTGEIECCDADGFWLVLADDCPFVPGQRVTITPASPTPDKEW